ncbi:hypothetical protein [Phormidium sp. CCY1219]|uniref:hypothetical protein n=1 Tax=Phormidium sp. CCY1219 TaxID=2886104 RepID=UPI002D1F2D36|nr:hypothetical protein [Phormidium sp. CCY1219]MEB3831665.1 hypothetical protein [Phormidium sp. CCY1219]
MNKKTSLSVLLAIATLLLGVQSCATNNEAQVSAENTPVSSPTAEVSETPETQAQTPETSADPLAEFDMEKAALLTDTAKLLAGMEVDDNSAIASVQDTRAWNDYAYALNTSWEQLEAQQISKVRKWAASELKSINATSPPIFYPFSGPDFLYGYSLFPEGREFVMVGLEPVGDIPNLQNLSPGQLNSKLQNVNQSLYAILQFSFFRTKDMAVDLADKGVLPILFVFMARTNNQILDVNYVGLDKEAKIQILDNGENTQGMIPGVKISFLPEGASEPRTVYYFSTDLSDEGLQKTPEFSEFVRQMGTPVTYLKAASYLMHYDSFSTIRNLIFDQSSHVLQDDSGIPLRYFDEQKWDLTFYGTYIQPIELFANMYQPKLRQVYQNNSNIKGLNFGIGYKYYNDSNLMLATKEDSASQP